MKKIIKITSLLAVLTQGAYLQATPLGVALSRTASLANLPAVVAASNALNDQNLPTSIRLYDKPLYDKYGVCLHAILANPDWVNELNNVQNALMASNIPATDVDDAITLVHDAHLVGNFDLLTKVFPNFHETFDAAWALITADATRGGVMHGPANAPRGARTLPTNIVNDIRDVFVGGPHTVADIAGLLQNANQYVPDLSMQSPRNQYTPIQVSAAAKNLVMLMKNEIWNADETLTGLAIPFAVQNGAGRQVPFFNQPANARARTLSDKITALVNAFRVGAPMEAGNTDDHVIAQIRRMFAANGLPGAASLNSVGAIIPTLHVGGMSDPITLLTAGNHGSLANVVLCGQDFAHKMEMELIATRDIIIGIAAQLHDADPDFTLNSRINPARTLSSKAQQLLNHLTGRIDHLQTQYLAAVATRDDRSDTDSDSDDSDLDNVTPAQRVNDLRALFTIEDEPTLADVINILNASQYHIDAADMNLFRSARVSGAYFEVSGAATRIIKAMKDWIMDRHDADAIQIQDLEGQGANALQVLNATIGLLEVAIDKINENNFGARGVTPIHYDANTSLDNPTQLTRSIRLSLGEMSSFAALGVKVTPAAQGGLGMRIAQAGGQAAPAAEANSDLADLIKEIGKHNAMCQSFVENQGLFHMHPATGRQGVTEGTLATHVNAKSAAFRSKLIELMNATADLAEVADDRAGFDVNEHPIYSLQVNLSGATPEDPTTRLHSVNGVYTLAADQRIHSIALLSVPAPAAEADHDNGTHEQD